MKKKILLIQPSPYDGQGGVIKKKKLYFVGLALPLLAALTPKRFDVQIILETIESIDFESDADIVGISSMGHGVIRSIDIAKEFRSRGKTVILGGYMVSLMPDEVTKYCDSLIIGDAENVWEELLSDYDNGKLKKIYKKELTKLSTPIPRYDLLLNKSIGDFLPVQAGRGCPKACSFCSVYCLYMGKYLKRDILEVVRDIKEVKNLGFNKFLLLDDNIFSDRDYAKNLCLEISKLKMKWMTQCSIDIGDDEELLRIIYESGCIALSFGLESITKESLDSMNKSWANPLDYSRLIKNIQQKGIDISTEMVVGADGDTLKSIRNTVDFIKDNKIAVPRFYILTPIPGTKFYDDMVRQNRICNYNIYSYNGSEAVHIPQNMTPKQLTKAYWELYNDVFKIKNIFKRTIWHKNFLKRPINYLFYFGVNMHYRHSIKRKIPPNII